MNEKDKPWIKLDASMWREVADLLCHPWPAWAVEADLRYHANQERLGGDHPSRRKLSARWGWPDRRARTALKKWGASQRCPKGVPKVSQDRPKTDTQTPVITGADVPTPSQRRPRGVPTPSTRAELKNKEQRTKNKELNLKRVWADLNEIRGGRSLTMNKSRAKKLEARIKEAANGADLSVGVDAVLRVARWRETSNHRRAVTLRDGGYGIDTLLGANKFQIYLDMSYETPPKISTGSRPRSLEGGLIGDFFSLIEPEIIDYSPNNQRIET